MSGTMTSYNINYYITYNLIHYTLWQDTSVNNLFTTINIKCKAKKSPAEFLYTIYSEMSKRILSGFVLKKYIDPSFKFCKLNIVKSFSIRIVWYQNQSPNKIQNLQPSIVTVGTRYDINYICLCIVCLIIDNSWIEMKFSLSQEFRRSDEISV